MKKLLVVVLGIMMVLGLSGCTKQTEVTYTQEEVNVIKSDYEARIVEYETQIKELEMNVLEHKMVRYINTIQEFILVKYDVYQGKATVTEHNVCYKGCVIDQTRIEFDSEAELLVWWDEQVDSFKLLIK